MEYNNNHGDFHLFLCTDTLASSCACTIIMVKVVMTSTGKTACILMSCRGSNKGKAGADTLFRCSPDDDSKKQRCGVRKQDTQQTGRKPGRAYRNIETTYGANATCCQLCEAGESPLDHGRTNKPTESVQYCLTYLGRYIIQFSGLSVATFHNFHSRPPNGCRLSDRSPLPCLGLKFLIYNVYVTTVSYPGQRRWNATPCLSSHRPIICTSQSGWTLLCSLFNVRSFPRVSKM